MNLLSVLSKNEIAKEKHVAGLKLKPNCRARVLGGHPWVFTSEVQKLLPPSHDGEIVECRDARGRLLGSGIYNSRSKIVWRRFSRQKSELNKAELDTLITRAIARRNPESVRRLVWSESDNLPGLIVDQYNETLAVQTLTLGMDRRLDIIVSILVDRLRPACVVARNDAPTRKLEGLEEKVFVIHGKELEADWLRIGNVEFFVDVMRGQKTGFYLDQREQHQVVATYAKNRRVLDAFCNQGGFSLYCARAGASSVLGVDISQDAVTQAQQNATHNGLKTEFIAANVFDFFRGRKNESWDLIVLDPPPFAKTKDKTEDALRGYKELHLRAMQHLSNCGILATYCCSHHISKEMFEAMLRDAAGDVERDVRILRRCTQPADHPVLLNIPESEYLHGIIMEVD